MQITSNPVSTAPNPGSPTDPGNTALNPVSTAPNPGSPTDPGNTALNSGSTVPEFRSAPLL